MDEGTRVVVVYTDGVCVPNPGKGGWGAVIVQPDGEIRKISGGSSGQTTNKRVPRGNEIAHAQLKIEDSMIEVADAIDEYQPNPTAIWLFVKDADAVYASALKAGAASLHEPTDQDYGDREASVKDSFGNHCYIATHRRYPVQSSGRVKSVTGPSTPRTG